MTTPDGSPAVQTARRRPVRRCWACQAYWEHIPAGHERADVADVAVGADGKVYVLTRREPKILVYAADGTHLHAIGDGILTAMPHGICVGPDGSVFCVLEDDCTVRGFKADGTLYLTLGDSGQRSDTGCDWSSSDGPSFRSRVDSIVRAAGPFNHPTGVALSSDGHIFVSDGYGNARVHKFSADGDLLMSWGEPGIGPGMFHVPHNLIVTADQRVVVADRENGRLQIFDTAGRLISIVDGLQRPTAVAEDAAGLLYVSEFSEPKGWWSWVRGVEVEHTSPARISVLDTTGTVLERLGPDATEGPIPLIAPHGIAVDGRDRIFVAEVVGTYTRGRTQFGDHDLDDIAHPTLQVIVPS